MKILKNLLLAVLSITVSICAIGQDSSILGHWEGIQYIGEKPTKSTGSRGGYSAPLIYDSCYVTMDITDVYGSGFSGTSYTYIFSDQKGTYCRSKVYGYLNGSVIHIKTEIVESRYEKYQGYFWCPIDVDFTLSRKGNVQLIKGKANMPGCTGGPGMLTKINPVVAQPANPLADKKPRESNSADTGIDSPLEKSFKERKADVAKRIKLVSDTVKVSFYDNAEVDNDSISIFFNGRLVSAHKRIDTRGYSLFLVFDKSRAVNEIAMYADNLGQIPPNTALMRLTDGDRVYSIFMKSDYKANATIELVR